MNKENYDHWVEVIKECLERGSESSPRVHLLAAHDILQYLIQMVGQEPLESYHDPFCTCGIKAKTGWVSRDNA